MHRIPDNSERTHFLTFELNLNHTMMNKVLTLILLVSTCFAGMSYADEAPHDQRQERRMKEGMKHGHQKERQGSGEQKLKEGLKDGSKHGLKFGLKHGLKEGKKNGEKR